MEYEGIDLSSTAIRLTILIPCILVGVSSLLLYHVSRIKEKRIARDFFDSNPGATLDEFMKSDTRKRYLIRKWIPIICGVAAGLLGNILVGASVYVDIATNLDIIINEIQTPREIIVIICALLLIMLSIVITIYLTPSRMTVIAGVALGFMGAVFLLEAFLWFNSYIGWRLEQEQASVLLETIPRPQGR